MRGKDFSTVKGHCLSFRKGVVKGSKELKVEGWKGGPWGFVYEFEKRDCKCHLENLL